MPLLRDEQTTYRRLVEFHADGSLNGHDSTMDEPVEAGPENWRYGASAS
jgi:hypothetical protein